MTMATITPVAPDGFGGEAFLSQHVPPNYPAERFRLGISLILAVVIWCFGLPLLAKIWLHSRRTSTRRAPTPPGKQHVKDNDSRQQPSSLWGGLFERTIDLTCVMLFLVSVGTILLKSSNNSYSARSVFEAPLLTRDECRQILVYSYEAAQANVENEANMSSSSSFSSNAQQQQQQTQNSLRLLEEPAGWQKTRHSSYPTTDLNLAKDPFSDEARQVIGGLLDSRLATLIARIYGVAPRAIRAYDMFVVRYDSQRTKLESHTDSGYISFNVLLSDDFDGGGTRFWNRLKHGPFALVQPPVGHVLLNSAVIRHEGMPITRGVRHILVGFLAIDPVDPLATTSSGSNNKHKTTSTGLSWFASWLSLSFLHVRLKEAYVASYTRLEELGKQQHGDASESSSLSTTGKWIDNRYVRSLMRDLILWVEYLGDCFSPHFHASLVADEDARNYLKALDDAPHETSLSWFEGQFLNLDAGGSIPQRTRQEVIVS